MSRPTLFGSISATFLIIALHQARGHERRQARSLSSSPSEEKENSLRPWQINKFAPALREEFRPFFEGDIAIDKRTAAIMNKPFSGRKSRRRQKRAAIRQRKRFWKKAIVPYEIDQTFPSRTKALIRDAIHHFEEMTCLRFRHRRKDDNDYIRYSYDPGCWSYIGRQGGRQRVVLGRGCDKFGTIIHETGHALGLWHEQSRKDRDKYVHILTENVSPSYQKEFGTVSKALTSPKGYPYDYESVMHYGEKYFTKNGKRTLEVIGVGKNLGLAIGQRNGLSALDIAQLSELYKCQSKNKKACRASWVQYENSCYKFFSGPRKQFAGAKQYCKNENSELLSIDDKGEDDFISRYLTKFKRGTDIWRTSGRKDSYYGWIWHHTDDRSHKRMEYKNWPNNEPGDKTTLVLVKDPNRPRYVWKGTWAGSAKQMPSYSYGFICEKDNTDRGCFRSRFRDGRDYRGTINYSEKGIICQKWTSQWPHQHTVLDANENKNKQNGLGEHNFCRNPNGRKARPWCYLTKSKIIWQYCDINLCSYGGRVV